MLAAFHRAIVRLLAADGEHALVHRDVHVLAIQTRQLGRERQCFRRLDDVRCGNPPDGLRDEIAIEGEHPFVEELPHSVLEIINAWKYRECRCCWTALESDECHKASFSWVHVAAATIKLPRPCAVSVGESSDIT